MTTLEGLASHVPLTAGVLGKLAGVLLPLLLDVGCSGHDHSCLASWTEVSCEVGEKSVGDGGQPWQAGW